MTLALEEKYDQVRQLIAMGKERGYLLYDEVNDILPAEVHSSEEIDDLLSTFERYGIDVYEDLSSAKAALAAADSPETPEGAKEDGVKVAFQHGKAIRRDGGAVLEIAVGRPVKGLKLHRRARGLNHPQGRGDYFLADAVTWDDGDTFVGHKKKI